MSAGLVSSESSLHAYRCLPSHCPHRVLPLCACILGVSLHVQISSSYQSYWIRANPYELILLQLSLCRLCLQMHSLSEVPRFRTWWILEEHNTVYNSHHFQAKAIFCHTSAPNPTLNDNPTSKMKTVPSSTSFLWLSSSLTLPQANWLFPFHDIESKLEQQRHSTGGQSGRTVFQILLRSTTSMHSSLCLTFPLILTEASFIWFPFVVFITTPKYFFKYLLSIC